MLDDAAFGAAWLESRDRARPRGERALDRGAAERVLARHGPTLARVADLRVRRQRAYALLARNGFDPETCAVAVRAFLADGESAAD